MLKQILAGSTFLLLLAIGSLPAHSQTPATEPTEPSAQPAPPAQPQPAAEVSSEEIERFARAIANSSPFSRKLKLSCSKLLKVKG
ncbi:MAG: hypothetical protein HC879_02350 [Leptolyngbyaceae cyanobacterium SL_5_9]|nr:hypothetical protein [Leptolyngbyaceae cyanobacterium SL_5_9]